MTDPYRVAARKYLELQMFHIVRVIWRTCPSNLEMFFSGRWVVCRPRLLDSGACGTFRCAQRPEEALRQTEPPSHGPPPTILSWKEWEAWPMWQKGWQCTVEDKRVFTR